MKNNNKLITNKKRNIFSAIKEWFTTNNCIRRKQKTLLLLVVELFVLICFMFANKGAVLIILMELLCMFTGCFGEVIIGAIDDKLEEKRKSKHIEQNKNEKTNELDKKKDIGAGETLTAGSIVRDYKELGIERDPVAGDIIRSLEEIARELEGYKGLSYYVKKWEAILAAGGNYDDISVHEAVTPIDIGETQDVTSQMYRGK